VRRFVQNVYYLWPRNQWYYRSIAGLIPIVPGVPTADGNTWILHIGGGRLAPWNSGLWNTLGRSYINKTQTLFARQSYIMKHSHPARVATAALGATEEDRNGVLAGVIRWALNAAFVLTPGWDLKLIESNGQGIKVYDADIENHNRDMATSLCGSSAMLQGTAGFSNLDVFRVVQTDLIETSSTSWDHTVNTQILPGFIGNRWGVDALRNATTIQTDVVPPKDKKVESDTYVQLANAIKGLVEAVAQAQVAAGVTEPVAVNVKELLERFGVPFEKTGVDPQKLLEAANDTNRPAANGAA
jgi:phage gp29-like protein